MKSKLDARIAILVVLFAVGGSIAIAGAASAQTTDDFDVGIEFPTEFTAEDNQTIEVTVENNENADLVSPLVEIPISNEFGINSSSNGSVTVTASGGGSDTRNSFIDDSTYRNGEALFIEGVSVESGETNSYEVGIDVASPGQTDVRVDVRPLNNEDNNERVVESEDALGFASIGVNSDSGSVTVTGEGTDVTRSGTFTEEVTQSLAGDQSYDVGADISILDEDLEITGLSPGVSNTESVWFSNITAGSAADPTVVGHTESTANILSPNTRTVRGNATTPTTVTTSYTLVTDGGSTYLVIEDQTTLTPWSETVNVDTDSGTISEIDQTDGVTLVNVTATDDVDGSFDFVGYRVGDIDESGDVTATDAADIAQAAADSDLDSINDYGDVTDSDDISVVDAMYIQQYLDGNRDADYDLTGGN
jgi:hypothetical protein